jgi:glycine/D-amino acid oxidase-like deaminating enzyme
MTTPPVVVVGAGIVGASVAYHLARAGTAVTLIDRASVPAAGATGASFAWIGDSSGEWPGGAEDLRISVRADYRRLGRKIPGISVRWTGSLDWTGKRAGQGIGRSQIRELEPHLRLPPARAVYSPTDGGVDPVGMTNAMVDAARRLGARVVLGSAVTALTVDRGRVRGVSSSTGYHAASTIVLATGAAVTALTEPVGVALPVAASPALLVRVAAPAGLIRTIVATPDFEARELRPGHLLLTAPVADPATVGLTVDRLRETFRNAGTVRLLDWAVGDRPMPVGGPVAGFLTPDRSTYVAVTSSGITLAPTLGRLVAHELTTGMPAPELRRCRPQIRAV